MQTVLHPALLLWRISKIPGGLTEFRDCIEFIPVQGRLHFLLRHLLIGVNHPGKLVTAFFVSAVELQAMYRQQTKWKIGCLQIVRSKAGILESIAVTLTFYFYVV